MAVFADGELANYRYEGAYDFAGGGGSFRGYALWKFDDGSHIHTTYVGEASRSGEGITFSGTHTVVKGSGRYAEATGTGAFKGRRVDNLEDGGDTFWSGTLSLTLP